MDITLKIPAKNLPYRAFLFFLTIEVYLVLLDYLFNVRDLTGLSQVRRFANLAREDGVGTWFASIQLFLVSLTAACIAHKTQGRGVGRRGWIAIALFFLFMSADESAIIHERLGSISKIYSDRMGNFMSYPWHVVVGPFFAVAGIVMLAFLFSEFKDRSMRLIVIAAYAILAIAIGLDFLEGMQISEYLAAHFPFDAPEIDHSLRIAEEILEMFGNTLFLTAFLTALVRRASQDSLNAAA